MQLQPSEDLSDNFFSHPWDKPRPSWPTLERHVKLIGNLETINECPCPWRSLAWYLDHLLYTLNPCPFRE